jgi:hypothetical protein
MKLYALLARIFAGITIITTWAVTTQPLMGVVFVLVLTALSALRYRFINAKLQKALPCIELVVCV